MPDTTPIVGLLQQSDTGEIECSEHGDYIACRPTVGGAAIWRCLACGSTLRLA